MARKRKVESSAAIVDESDKVLYSVFGNLPRNSLNYTLKLLVIRGFHLKLDKDMLFKVTTEDISAYLRNELNNNSNASYESMVASKDELIFHNSWAVRQSQDKNKNLCFAFDSEMDTTPEGSAH
ncbi:hypothetical protein NC652_009942 [Populus alba x Populus x berolinensis]|uniref:Uncharacterized protein n=1 Tax=Populus alba x Populus x berolinensis TaxID=444605 RepID=A0AAD6RAT7_9ROSI|nr:hypothetical protein NC652_009942 [Populus alba x Populus x berolinensis]KAJ7005321.1 hypothetical protein NC653_009964 [Populus alba x Populus x berolinensis]